MLVLTRKLDESIIIGDNIIIQILDSRAGQIRIGITAPRDISVHRHEVYERIHGHLPQIENEIEEEKEGK
jgi:carbon storage regulator